VIALHLGLITVLWLVFAVSTAGKLRTWRGFVASLRPLGLLPGRLVPATAVAVATAEVTVLLGLSAAVAGVLDLVPAGPVVRFGGLVAAAALLGVLTGGIALALRRGSSAPCACFGASTRPLGGRHLVRNAILLLVAAGALVTPAGPVVPAGALLGAAAGALVAVLLIRLDDLVELLAPARPLSPATLRRN
jgi:Methylamine utilisation protein MauE